MKTESVIAHFKGISETALALKITRDSIYKWGEVVPEARQFEIEVKTCGKLKSDWSLQQAAVMKGET